MSKNFHSISERKFFEPTQRRAFRFNTKMNSSPLTFLSAAKELQLISIITPFVLKRVA